MGKPNFMFILVTALFATVSYQNNNWWPLIAWVMFNLALIPVIILLDRIVKKKEQKLVEDFPDDPIIQEKYGRKDD